MIKQVQEYLAVHELDAFLVLTPMNRRYLSGFTGEDGTLLITRNDAVLLVDGRYTLRAKYETGLPIKNIARLSDFFSRSPSKTVAVEDKITLRELANLKKLRRGMVWKPTRNIIEDLRAVKIKAELAAIAQGGRMIDKVFEQIKRVIKDKPRIREIQVVEYIKQFGKRWGAQDVAFDPIVAWGPNSANPHHCSGQTKLGRHNFLLLDFGFKVRGYHSDFTRTLFIGRPSGYQRKIYETVWAAQQQALSQIRIGQKASAIDAAARNFIARAGFGQYFVHATGHGVGLEIHEPPALSAKSPAILKDNMVITVEPGIYLPGKFGIRIEDMAQTGRIPKVFSKIPKDFASMIVNF